MGLSCTHRQITNFSSEIIPVELKATPGETTKEQLINENLQEKLEESEKQVEQLLSVNEKMKNAMRNAANVMAEKEQDLADKLSQASAALNLNEEQKASLAQELQRSAETIKILEDSIQKNGDIREYYKTELQQRELVYNQNIQNAEKQNLLLQENVRQMYATNIHLKTKLEDEVSINKSLQDRTLQLAKDLTDKNQHLSNLKAQEEVNLEEIRSTRREVVQLRRNLEGLQKKNEKFRKEMTSRAEMIDQLGLDLNKKNEQLTKLSAESAKERKNFIKRIADLEFDLQRQGSDIISLNALKTKLGLDLENQDNQLSVLQQAYAELSKNYDKILKDFDSVLIKNDALRNRIQLNEEDADKARQEWLLQKTQLEEYATQLSRKLAEQTQAREMTELLARMAESHLLSQWQEKEASMQRQLKEAMEALRNPPTAMDVDVAQSEELGDWLAKKFGTEEYAKQRKLTDLVNDVSKFILTNIGQPPVLQGIQGDYDYARRLNEFIINNKDKYDKQLEELRRENGKEEEEEEDENWQPDPQEQLFWSYAITLHQTLNTLSQRLNIDWNPLKDGTLSKQELTLLLNLHVQIGLTVSDYTMNERTFLDLGLDTQEWHQLVALLSKVGELVPGIGLDSESREKEKKIFFNALTGFADTYQHQLQRAATYLNKLSEKTLEEPTSSPSQLTKEDLTHIYEELLQSVDKLMPNADQTKKEQEVARLLRELFKGKF
jgi:hypothetical protein